MGIYNNIHDYNDDQFYYCTLNDCACSKRIDYYDTSNNFHKPTRANNARTTCNGSSTTHT